MSGFIPMVSTTPPPIENGPPDDDFTDFVDANEDEYSLESDSYQDYSIPQFSPQFSPVKSQSVPEENFKETNKAKISIEDEFDDFAEFEATIEHHDVKPDMFQDNSLKNFNLNEKAQPKNSQQHNNKINMHETDIVSQTVFFKDSISTDIIYNSIGQDESLQTSAKVPEPLDKGPNGMINDSSENVTTHEVNKHSDSTLTVENLEFTKSPPQSDTFGTTDDHDISFQNKPNDKKENLQPSNHLDNKGSKETKKDFSSQEKVSLEHHKNAVAKEKSVNYNNADNSILSLKNSAIENDFTNGDLIGYKPMESANIDANSIDLKDAAQSEKISDISHPESKNELAEFKPGSQFSEIKQNENKDDFPEFKSGEDFCEDKSFDKGNFLSELKSENKDDKVKLQDNFGESKSDDKTAANEFASDDDFAEFKSENDFAEFKSQDDTSSEVKPNDFALSSSNNIPESEAKSENDFAEFQSRDNFAEFESEDNFAEFKSQDDFQKFNDKVTELKPKNDFGGFSSVDEFAEFKSQDKSSANNLESNDTQGFAAFEESKTPNHPENCPKSTNFSDDDDLKFSDDDDLKFSDDDDDFGDFSDKFSTAPSKETKIQLSLEDKIREFSNLYENCYSKNSNDGASHLKQLDNWLHENYSEHESAKQIENVDGHSAMPVTWSGEVWECLEDIDNTNALTFVWNGSQHNKNLIKSLGLNLDNLMFAGNNKAYYVPSYYAIGLDTKDYNKGILKPMSAAEKITAISPKDKNFPSNPLPPDSELTKKWDSNEDSNMAPVMDALAFDVGYLETSGNSNKSTPHSNGTSDLIDPSLLEFTTAPSIETPPVKDSGSAKLTKLLASIKQTSSTPTVPLSQGSVFTPEEEASLPQEAKNVIMQLPDLSYMRSKVLMFPVNFMSRVKMQDS